MPARADAIVSIACHTLSEVRVAAEKGGDFALFGPVFEKREGRTPSPPAGLSLLKHVCQQDISIIALGGITLENAHSCINAGAAGIAGIRIFQENKISQVVRQLKKLVDPGLSPHSP
jgi:thiamine-phosphate pyrophosphorylase